MGASKIGASFKNVQTILFGPRGDGFPADMLVMRERLAQFPRIICSNLRNQEMSFGSLPRLIEIIAQTLAENPGDVIVVLETLSTSLLKEDVKTAIEKIKGRAESEIILMECDYFKDQEDAASAKTLLKLIELYGAVGGENRSAKPSVNIIGPALLSYNYLHDLLALKQIITDLGIEINLVLPMDCSVFDLKKINRAWVNLSTDIAISSPTLDYLQAACGQPYLPLPPVGLENTREYIGKLAGIFQRDYKDYIEKNEMELKTKWDLIRLQNDLTGKSVCVFGDITSVIGLSTIFRRDLNMSLKFAGTYNLSYREFFNQQMAGLAENYLATDDSAEVNRKIREADSNLILGTLNEERLANRLKLPYVRISAPMRHATTLALPFQSFVGYAGIQVRNLENKNATSWQLYNMGGYNSLRGYREDEFSSYRLGWTNYELRYRLSPDSRVYLLFDQGFLGLDENRLKYDIFGLGAGIKVKTRLGILGIEYALGYRDKRFSSLGLGMIHAGLDIAF